MVLKKVLILNQLGLHARPAALFVQTAAGFQADIKVLCKEKEVNAKSIMGIMSLGAGQGDEITIKAEGVEAEKAVTALVELVKKDI
jgi:phosphocarrier protein HPr